MSIDASISSNVFPFVSGTTIATNRIANPLKLASMKNVPTIFIFNYDLKLDYKAKILTSVSA